MIVRAPPLLLGSIALALALGGCDRPVASGPIAVGVIGPPLDARPARARTPAAADLVLRGAIGGGLVRFDQAGQIVPAVAVRWAIVDDGLDGIFRIEGSAGLTAATIAARLRASLAGEDRRLFRDGIDRIAAVTGDVVELRLAVPRSDLLALLAAPELATLDDASGAMRIASRRGGDILLAPRAVPGAPSPSPPPIRLRGERVGRAVAGFAAGTNQLVLGGTFADLAVARAADLPRGALRIDPAAGLFGLVPRSPAGAYTDPDVLAALSLAIDRDRIAALLGAPDIGAATPAGAPPATPLADRRAQAIAALAGRSLPPLRLALPAGPGARLLGRLLTQDWARLGIATSIVAAQAPADLVLIDRVLPAGEIARAACLAAPGCDPHLENASLTPRYIPLGHPLRWSLAARELDLFTENALAAHPLDRLRTAR